MVLEEFKPFWFEAEWRVIFEISNAIGMCRKKCTNCRCLQRVVQECIALGIAVPPYNENRKHSSPIFTMNQQQLLNIRKNLEDKPEPEVW